MEVKSLIQGHKTRLGWRPDSNEDSPIPNPHSQLFLHNTERQPRGKMTWDQEDRGGHRKNSWREGWDQSLSSTVGTPGTADWGVMQGEAGQIGGHKASGASLRCLNFHRQQGARERSTGKQRELHVRKETVTLPFTMDRTLAMMQSTEKGSRS